MSFEMWLALKYFRARRKSAARFTAAIAIVGIACGAACLIVGQAAARGFADEMREKILNNTPHIAVFQASGEPIAAWRIVERELKKIENVDEITPTTYQSALLVSEKNTSYVVLRATQSPESTVESPKPENLSSEIEIGAELAEKSGLKTGESTEIVLPPTSGELAPNKFAARVAETFRTGVYDYDATWIRIAPEDLARVSGQHNFEPTVLNISVSDVFAADRTAEKIREILPADFKAVDWQTANRPLFAALALEKKVSLLIISLVMFIAALNITTTLALLVGERKSDIAILRTCGARSKSLIYIFLFEGLFLGATGIFAGVVAGLTACAAGNYFKIINLPSEIYSISYVPLRPAFGDVLSIVIIALCLSLAATAYPAFRAARIKPLENLRNS